VTQLLEVLEGPQSPLFGIAKWIFSLVFAHDNKANEPRGGTSAHGREEHEAAGHTFLNLALDDRMERNYYCEAFRWLRESKSSGAISTPFNVEKVATLDREMKWQGKNVFNMFKLVHRASSI
jgi:hypothetical protein